jgi:hypothetical protein
MSLFAKLEKLEAALTVRLREWNKVYIDPAGFIKNGKPQLY